MITRLPGTCFRENTEFQTVFEKKGRGFFKGRRQGFPGCWISCHCHRLGTAFWAGSKKSGWKNLRSSTHFLRNKNPGNIYYWLPRLREPLLLLERGAGDDVRGAGDDIRGAGDDMRGVLRLRVLPESKERVPLLGV